MSSNIARHHHYLSQFYLKGFTNGRSKKSKLTVIDLKERKRFLTKPRNVGGIRDFNRIDLEGIDPDGLEKDLSKFEGEVATAIKKIEEVRQFDGENRSLVLNLMAMLTIRHPDMRDNIRQFHVDVMSRMMDLALETKERWEGQVAQMRAAGYDIGDVTYEDLKKFHDEKQYTINIAREWHIELELKSIGVILAALANRGWILVFRREEVGPLITSDRPILLYWNNPEEIPPLFRHSPGYSMKDTTVYFPLSQDCALVGMFEVDDAVVTADAKYIAHLNTVVMHLSGRQLYCPKLGFEFVGVGGELLTGKDILHHLDQLKDSSAVGGGDV